MKTHLMKLALILTIAVMFLTVPSAWCGELQPNRMGGGGMGGGWNNMRNRWDDGWNNMQNRWDDRMDNMRNRQQDRRDRWHDGWNNMMNGGGQHRGRRR